MEWIQKQKEETRKRGRKRKEIERRITRNQRKEQRRAAKENKEKMIRIEMGGWASVEAINDQCMHDYNLSKKIELQSTKLMKLHEDRHMRSKEEQLEKTKRR